MIYWVATSPLCPLSGLGLSERMRSHERITCALGTCSARAMLPYCCFAISVRYPSTMRSAVASAGGWRMSCRRRHSFRSAAPTPAGSMPCTSTMHLRTVSTETPRTCAVASADSVRKPFSSSEWIRYSMIRCCARGSLSPAHCSSSSCTAVAPAAWFSISCSLDRLRSAGTAPRRSNGLGRYSISGNSNSTTALLVISSPR